MQFNGFWLVRLYLNRLFGDERSVRINEVFDGEAVVNKLLNTPGTDIGIGSVLLDDIGVVGEPINPRAIGV